MASSANHSRRSMRSRRRLGSARGAQPGSKEESDCRHLALLRMPARSECRHNLAENMHAFDPPLYLAISTIDALRARTTRTFDEQDRQDGKVVRRQRAVLGGIGVPALLLRAATDMRFEARQNERVAIRGGRSGGGHHIEIRLSGQLADKHCMCPRVQADNSAIVATSSVNAYVSKDISVMLQCSFSCNREMTKVAPYRYLFPPFRPHLARFEVLGIPLQQE